MVKTNNSHFEEKVKLRIDGLPDKNPVKVLDMLPVTLISRLTPI